MAGASVTIENTASETLIRLVAIANDPSVIMRDIAGYVLFSTQRRFETETGPDGVKWKALSPRTAKARIGRGKVRGYAHILRQSNRLYQSLIMASDSNTSQVGTNAEYALIHQAGGDIEMPERQARVTFKKIRGANNVRFVKPGTKDATVKDVTIGAHIIRMPARPYLGINEADQVEIAAVALDAIGREVGK
jgi:phage virion morphogenesis protein